MPKRGHAKVFLSQLSMRISVLWASFSVSVIVVMTVNGLPRYSYTSIVAGPVTFGSIWSADFDRYMRSMVEVTLAYGYGTRCAVEQPATVRLISTRKSSDRTM